MRCPHKNTAIKYEFGAPPSTAITVITHCKDCGAEIVRHTYNGNPKPAPASDATVKV